MQTYMQHVAGQQAASHRGQVQLNETFYNYTMHRQSQDPSPFPWPTPSSSGPQWHDLEMSPILRQGQDPHGPLGTTKELRRMMIWLMCQISSLEEAELHSQDRWKNFDFVYYSILSLSVFICYLISIKLDSMLALQYLLFHFDRLELDVIAFSFCYLIVIYFTSSSVLAYYCIAMVCLNKKKLSKKNRALCIVFFSFTRLFVPLIKCNLG